MITVLNTMLNMYWLLGNRKRKGNNYFDQEYAISLVILVGNFGQVIVNGSLMKISVIDNHSDDMTRR